jgi:3-phosphoshikimate 1-carboxyvinyltransferase
MKRALFGKEKMPPQLRFNMGRTWSMLWRLSRQRGRSFRMDLSDARTVAPSPRLSGTVRVPGDKSVSHRAAMLAGLADGVSTIHGYLTGEDCLNTMRAVEALGARVEREGATFRVRGCAGAFNPPGRVLDMGNSGTGMRLMAGVAAGQPFAVEMTGDASLRSRPMRRIQGPLEQMGARVELLGPNGCAPVRITGGRLRGIEYQMPVASAQVKSCVLLAGLFADGPTTVIEPEKTRDHTERMLRAAGVAVRRDGLRVSVDGSAGGRPAVRARDWRVPGDFSSAAFWMVAAACRPGAEVCVEGVGLNPSRTALLEVLRRMGAAVEVRAEPDGDGSPDSGEPIGSVAVRGRGLRATEIGGAEIPNLIDEIPVLCAAAALAEGRTVIRDAAELRVKESDRIAAMAALLQAFGVKVEQRPDGMVVEGGRRLGGGATVDSLGDHRVAMTAAVMALFADRPVTVRGVACIATSYPAFWDDLARVSA